MEEAALIVEVDRLVRAGEGLAQIDAIRDGDLGQNHPAAGQIDRRFGQAVFEGDGATQGSVDGFEQVGAAALLVLFDEDLIELPLCAAPQDMVGGAVAAHLHRANKKKRVS